MQQKNKIQLFDTTLRDGTQSPEVNLSIHDKIEVVKALDDFGFDYIELGWPGSNPKDMECFNKTALLKLKNSKIVAFGSTRKKETKAAQDPNLGAILKSKAPVTCIFGKTWLVHVEKQLKSTGKENLNAISDSITFLKKKKLEVIYDLEHFFDGFKDNEKYALDCLKVAADANADCLVLCDTNGGCLAREIIDIVKKVRKFMEENKIKTELGIHVHNDSGLALANSLAAIDLGITHVHGTINGFGERCGNLDFCELLPNLILKKKKRCEKIKLKKLRSLSNLLYTLSNIHPEKKQPFVGNNAFSHKGGVHVDAMMKGASYEHITPEDVGNKREIILSDLSGKANIVEIAKKFSLDIKKDNPNVKEMLKKVEIMEKKGYGIGDLKAEKAILTEKYFGKGKSHFTISTWRITSEERNGEYSECVLTGTVKGKELQVVAPIKGGPVGAIYNALQKLIGESYPKIKQVSLINYKVMIAEDIAAQSSVRVFIEFKNSHGSWGTVGVSTNILEASLEAIRKGFEYYLIKNY